MHAVYSKNQSQIKARKRHCTVLPKETAPKFLVAKRRQKTEKGDISLIRLVAQDGLSLAYSISPFQFRKLEGRSAFISSISNHGQRLAGAASLNRQWNRRHQRRADLIFEGRLWGLAAAAEVSLRAPSLIEKGVADRPTTDRVRIRVTAPRLEIQGRKRRAEKLQSGFYRRHDDPLCQTSRISLALQ
ncbi:hypothetical protein TcasGA2_TC008347 [Tribolium castaneum]|uniref:Uncharacterized protein n=1 Tax=Tribolium castaneum TaxID=7070 RepID=D2A176_TRICA|nr:hypothetical protein TcasGA2_TC008347 [Tribolium castaneum]